MNKVYSVCYESSDTIVVFDAIGNRPNNVVLFYDYEKAKEFAEKLMSKNYMVFISKGKPINGIVLNKDIIWEDGCEY